MSTTAMVTPEVVQWGRLSAGLSVDEAAKLLAVNPSRVEDWESGTAKPTMGQVRKMATKYRRPLNVFFLARPPIDDATSGIPDYRRARSTEPIPSSRHFVFSLRQMDEWRADALDLYRELDTNPPSFGLKINRDSDPEEAGSKLRSWLSVDNASLARLNKSDAYGIYNFWRSRLEANGVLVFHSSRVPLAEMRGAALYHERLPVVLVNPADYPRARSFTLLHELTHLSLRASGICQPSQVRPNDPTSDPVEVFCNHVAGAALLPREVLLREPFVREAVSEEDFSDHVLEALSHNLGVSRYVLLRRLLIQERVSSGFYNHKQRQWDEEFSNRRDSRDSGGDGRRIALSARGKLFTGLVLAALGNGAVSLYRASKLLGLKSGNIGFAREYTD